VGRTQDARAVLQRTRTGGLIGKPATFWIYAFIGVLATGFIWPLP
jgi:hypothetical protein